MRLSLVAAARGVYALTAALILMACKPSSEGSDKASPPRPSVEASAALPSSAAGAASAAPSAGASAGADAPKEGSAKVALAGSWQGAYDAKKGSVEMPPKVKDKPRSSDDGKAMSGPGKVEIEIAADGSVRGKASGALGEATLSGKLDEAAGVLRTSWFPVDPSAPNAMTGVLIGLVKEGAIQGEIRVAGPDATVVREAKIELKRK